MTQLQRIKNRLGISDTTQDTLLEEYLYGAEVDIMNKRFPFGWIKTEGAQVIKKSLEPQYYNLQIELAIVKYNQRGIEGQTEHDENGIRRSYGDTLLDQVVPFVKTL